MKVLITVAIWGRKYAKIFTDYSLASQLAPENIPRLTSHHEVTYHIITTVRDANWLLRQPEFQRLTEHASLLWDFIEDYGYDPQHIPTGPTGEKYPFVSRLQNIAFGRSLERDVLVFNYADFVWADGALTQIVETIEQGNDAVLGFCLPVDKRRGMRALDKHRVKESRVSTLSLPNRTAVAIALDNLHREAKLRFWNHPQFTSMPTYLIWPVGREGLLIRAYHQTVLALRVRPADANYRAGIRYGSLDGYFTALLAGSGRVSHATDSDQVMVFSLYDTKIDSGLQPTESREDAVRQCLRASVSEGQRGFAQLPIYFKRDYRNSSEWQAVERASAEIIEQYHRTTVPDQMAFTKIYADQGDLASVHQKWRTQPAQSIASKLANLPVWAYRLVLSSRILTWLSNVLKSTIGPARARSWRLAIERWLYLKHPAD
jgi:hypothetical protein